MWLEDALSEIQQMGKIFPKLFFISKKEFRVKEYDSVGLGYFLRAAFVS